MRSKKIAKEGEEKNVVFQQNYMQNRIRRRLKIYLIIYMGEKVIE